VLGGLRDGGGSAGDIDALFSGQGHAPSPIGPADQPRPPTTGEALDLPDWLMEAARHGTGDELPRAAPALRRRAPVFLRANPARASRADLAAALARQGVQTQLIPYLNYGLEVIEGERKIASLDLFSDGWFELQDASSQRVIEALALPVQGRVLDYCAGGGGKILSIAAHTYENEHISCHAYDANPRRMADLPARAARAEARIEILQNLPNAAQFDLILTDVPCSGSGSWRRDPQGKWALTPDKLAQVLQSQAQILDTAAQYLAPGGRLAYSTCSVLAPENEAQISAFLARAPQFRCARMQRFGLTDGTGGDGFFLAELTH